MAKQFLICKWILFDISNFAIIDKNNLECCCSSIAAAVVINERNLIKRCREESASTPVNNAIKTPPRHSERFFYFWLRFHQNEGILELALHTSPVNLHSNIKNIKWTFRKYKVASTLFFQGLDHIFFLLAICNPKEKRPCCLFFFWIAEKKIQTQVFCILFISGSQTNPVFFRSAYWPSFSKLR